MSEQKIPQGYKQTEVGVIPEDWLVEPLENFTSFISYGFTNWYKTIDDYQMIAMQLLSLSKTMVKLPVQFKFKL